jgi:hypothetical protein
MLNASYLLARLSIRPEQRQQLTFLDYLSGSGLFDEALYRANGIQIAICENTREFDLSGSDAFVGDMIALLEAKGLPNNIPPNALL